MLPKALFKQEIAPINIYTYTSELAISRNKVVLEQNVISFLVEGYKEVNFAGSAVNIDDQQALIMLQGNCLMSERVPDASPYKSVLLFFAKEKLRDLLVKHHLGSKKRDASASVSQHFVIDKDDYVQVFVQSLIMLMKIGQAPSLRILEAKFEEIMLYLIDRYGAPIISFLQNTVSGEHELSFRNTVEANKYSALGIEEVAFLCNMSISTFKRHFIEVYGQSPGKWFKTQKLSKAKELLQLGNTSPSELHRRFGYENLSNFSAAFKNEFGFSPSALQH